MTCMLYIWNSDARMLHASRESYARLDECVQAVHAQGSIAAYVGVVLTLHPYAKLCIYLIFRM